MTGNLLVLEPGDNLQKLYDLMVEKWIRHVPIVNRERKLVGLVSHRDLLRFAFPLEKGLTFPRAREALANTKIEEIMVRDVETVGANTSIKEAVNILLENKYGCLPVVEKNELVGILTEADFVRCAAV